MSPRRRHEGFRRYWFVVRPFSGLIRGPPAPSRAPTGGGQRVKLVTFGYDRVGCSTGTRSPSSTCRRCASSSSDGGADETGERVPLAESELRAPIVPKKFFHTAGNFREHEEESKQVGWSHEIAPWIVFFQNVDAIVGPEEPVVYPEHLTEELDYELELAVVISKDGEVVPARGGDRLHRRVRDLQRHHRARHPAPRDALGRLLASARRSTRSARSGRGSSRLTRSPTRTTSRWSCASTARCARPRTRAA